MAAEKGVVLEASQVSESFVAHYYEVVGTMTQAAHKYYTDDSLVTRPGPDGTTMSFSSLEAIKKHYRSSYYDGNTFDVVSIDSQRSLGDGIFVMVTGFLTRKDKIKRKFIQAFYLARQKTLSIDYDYVVVNDIHRFVDEESSTTTRALPATAVSEDAKPNEEVKKTKQVNKATKKSVNNAAEVKKVVPEIVVTAQKPKEPVAKTSAAAPPPPLDGAKISYASMALSLSRNAAPFQVKAAPVQKPSSVAQPKPHVAPAPEKKSDQKMVDEPGTSIFVSNLPMDSKWLEVYELFKGFGPIKKHGVQIRNSRAGGCFGFVAFESAASVQSVLKAAMSNQFKLGEYWLHVKEKQVFVYDESKQSGVRIGGGIKSQSGSLDGGKTQSGSADVSKTQSGSLDGSKTEKGSADVSKTEKGSADRSKTEKGSVGAEEDDDFQLVTSRRSRKEKKRQE